MNYLVYGKPSCGYCEKAKRLLSSKKIPHEYVDISKDTLLQFKLKSSGIRTVPAIYLDGEYIGGYTELVIKLSEED